MTAGSLDLKVFNPTTQLWVDNPAVPALVTITDMKPLYDKWSQPMYLKVVDNPAKLWVRITNVTCVTNGVTEPEAATGDPTNWLPNVTRFQFKVDGIVGNIMWMNAYIGTWLPLTTTTVGGQHVIVEQYFQLFDTAGNEYQSDQCIFDEQFLALQTNDDSNPNIPCITTLGLTFTKKATSFPESDVFEINGDRYITKQLNEGNSALQLEMDYTPSAGDVIEYDVDYLSGSGNHMSRIVINGNYLDEHCWEVWNGSGCGAIGYWNGVHGFGDELGTYHMKVVFSNTGVEVTATTPSNAVKEAAMNITSPASFGVESHSGHNGLFHFDYYNFRVISCNDW
jgi:hypothetical protein